MIPTIRHSGKECQKTMEKVKKKKRLLGVWAEGWMNRQRTEAFEGK